jgi:hypothetical protein
MEPRIPFGDRPNFRRTPTPPSRLPRTPDSKSVETSVRSRPTPIASPTLRPPLQRSLRRSSNHFSPPHSSSGLCRQHPPRQALQNGRRTLSPVRFGLRLLWLNFIHSLPLRPFALPHEFKRIRQLWPTRTWPIHHDLCQTRGPRFPYHLWPPTRHNRWSGRRRTSLETQTAFHRRFHYPTSPWTIILHSCNRATSKVPFPELFLTHEKDLPLIFLDQIGKHRLSWTAQKPTACLRNRLQTVRQRKHRSQPCPTAHSLPPTS